MDYYGVFRDLKDLNMGEIQEFGIYEGIFSTVYANMQSSPQELEFYIENAFCTGKRILEIACGDGGNYMIPMAKKGFEVDGIELSQDMIERFCEKKARLPEKVKKRVCIYQSDIFEYETEKKYDLITIPSTSICLLADNEMQTKLLLKKIYSWLNPGGRLMFDYRVDQSLASEYISPIYWETNRKHPYVMFMQEFNNLIPERGIVNMYVEAEENGVLRKYISSSNKRIITDELVYRLLEETKFKLHNTYMVEMENAKVKLLVLAKDMIKDE